ncbi:MAG: alpha/beta hydrolase [Acidobacteria bacterium]|nr:alpha/beta hydrolase [Acidobacteriota bacterium]
MMRSIVIGVLFLFLAFGMAEWMRRQSLFYPQKYPAGDWDVRALEIEPEELTFEASDGTVLHGWLFRSPRAESPLIVFFHGNGGNLTHRTAPAIGLARTGFDVFLFDYRGYGRSEGRPTERGLYDDSLAAWDVMRSRHQGPMIAYGESLGGPYAAYVASIREPCAVIADSTFPSLGSVARAVYRPIPIHWLLRPGLETARHLEAAAVPVLVMHSSNDGVIPFRLGRELFDRLDVPKEFYEVEDGMHSALFWADPEGYLQSIRSFVGTHCENGTGG